MLNITDDYINLALIIVGGVGLIYVYLLHPRKKSFPKGKDSISFKELPTPNGFPILGHLTKMGNEPHVTLTKWSKQYGMMYRIRMGFQDVLIVSGIKNIRNALMKHSVVFGGRPHIETLQASKKQGNISIAFSDYSPEWLYEKGIAKAAISLYTTGKDPTKRSTMEMSSYKHANSLVDQLLKEAKCQNNKVDPRSHILSNVTNVVSKICFGEEFELDDPKFVRLLQLYRDFDKALGITQVADFWPILKYRYFPVISKAFKSLHTFNNQALDIVKSSLKKHWITYDDNNVRDLLDSLYHERKKLRKKIGDNLNDAVPDLKTDTGADAGDIKSKIIGTSNTIFQAGFDTTFTMIHWTTFYLAAFPDTQEKMREEIEEVLSPDEQPSYRIHAGRCHYTMAWMYELIRHVSPLPILLPHATTQDIEFENCFLPKGLSIYFNTHQVHNDPELWKNPQKFSPERFLNPETQCFKPNLAANVIAWGMGKRFCPGKDLSKHAMFIFITTIVRRLHIKQSIPGVEPAFPWPVELGISTKSKDFQIEITERKR